MVCHSDYWIRYSYCKCYVEKWHITGNPKTMTDCNIQLALGIIAFLTIIPNLVMLVKHFKAKNKFRTFI